MALIIRALKNRDCDVPDYVYRLKFKRERQKLVAGIACFVEIDTEIPGRREYYLLTCNNVRLKSRYFLLVSGGSHSSLPGKKEASTLTMKIGFQSKISASWLLPITGNSKRAWGKSTWCGNLTDSIESLIIENSHVYCEIEWKKNDIKKTAEQEGTSLQEMSTKRITRHWALRFCGKILKQNAFTSLA